MEVLECARNKLFYFASHIKHFKWLLFSCKNILCEWRKYTDFHKKDLQFQMNGPKGFASFPFIWGNSYCVLNFHFISCISLFQRKMLLLAIFKYLGNTCLKLRKPLFAYLKNMHKNVLTLKHYKMSWESSSW